MSPISISIFTCWGVVILLRAAALVTILRRGLWRFFPVMFIVLAVASLRSIYVLSAYFSCGAEGYTAAWLASKPVLMIFDGMLVLEAYLVQAHYAPRFSRAGCVFLALFVGLAIAVAIAAAPLGVGDSLKTITLGRNFALACFVTVYLSWGFFQIARVPMPPNASRHSQILMLWFMGELIATSIREAETFWTIAAAQFIGLGTAGCCYLLWMVLLTQEGEATPMQQPPAPEEFREQETWWNDVLRAIRQISDRYRRTGGTPVGDLRLW